jgi:hypothetical protein
MTGSTTQLRDGLWAAGLGLAAATVVFYKQKRTIPFKVMQYVNLMGCRAAQLRLAPPQTAYILAWPTLGTALMLTVQPSEQQVRN